MLLLQDTKLLCDYRESIIYEVVMSDHGTKIINKFTRDDPSLQRV